MDIYSMMLTVFLVLNIILAEFNQKKDVSMGRPQKDWN